MDLNRVNGRLASGSFSCNKVKAINGVLSNSPTITSYLILSRTKELCTKTLVAMGNKIFVTVLAPHEGCFRMKICRRENAGLFSVSTIFTFWYATSLLTSFVCATTSRTSHFSTTLVAMRSFTIATQEAFLVFTRVLGVATSYTTSIIV